MAFVENNHLSIAIILGALPTLLWLWFWLREDKRKPEPQPILILTFFAGMAAVLLALGIEYLVILGEKAINIAGTAAGSIIMLLLWAFTEEFLKYLAAREMALKRPCCDEPVDYLIYMITAALGFAALENILFIFNVGATEGALAGFITGNLRFLGATLLHTASSAIVGASMAFSFFHKENMRRNVIGGILLATLLHFIFNFFIIKIEGGNIFNVFIPLWFVIIAIIFIFEKVKRIKKI